MDAENALKKRLELIARMKALKPRLSQLPKKGMSIAAFCRKYKLDDSHLCHQTAGRRGVTKKQADYVEKCLKKEGV